MTNYSKLFYWLTVADNAKSFFIVFIIIFTLISVIATIAYLANGSNADENGQMMSRKWMWWSYPFMLLFWTLFIFTPSKRDSLLIIAGGQTLNFLTTDSTARQIPHELTSFVVTELKNMAEEAKVELGIMSEKDRILDEAKKMTTEELIEKMKTDPNLSKIILDK
jgi:hypothetical protein